MGMAGIKIDNKTKTVLIEKAAIKNDLIFEYFKKTPVGKRENVFQKALYIGVLALVEDRLSAFLAKTKNELGTELERLKIIFDMETEMFIKSAVKGKWAEQDVRDVLNKYFDRRGWRDKAVLVGDQEGHYKYVKTGDVLCLVDGDKEKKIIVEVKFQKSLPVGDIAERALKNNTDNIWGQLIEAKANREAQQAIIVFDRTISPGISDKLGPVSYIPKVGFVVVVDAQEGDFHPLFAAYNVARSIIISDVELVSRNAILRKIVQKVLHEIKNVFEIKKIIEKNMKNDEKILKILEQSMKDLELTDAYVGKLLEGEKIDAEKLYEFFVGKQSKV